VLTDLSLCRYPQTRDPNLRAYSAADEYLLWQLSQAPWRDPILVVNDAFGALTVVLQQYPRYFYSDSFLATRAMQINLKNNQCPTDNLALLSLELAENNVKLSPQPATHFDRVILRVPKHHSLLKMQLGLIKPFLKPGAQIIAAGMSKEIHRSTLATFEQVIGHTHTSLARKKARLIFSENTIPYHASNEPTHFKTVSLAEFGFNLQVLPGVFSRDKLDMGTRVLLNCLPELSPGRWLDLGCGSGVIGCYLQKRYADAQLVFSDESQVAILSTQHSFRALFGQKSAEFHHTDGTLNISGGFDAVFCNPPFHQNNAQNIALGKRMIINAHKALKPGGELWLVANRHLPYAKPLRHRFSSVNMVSRDPKFIVWHAQK